MSLVFLNPMLFPSSTEYLAFRRGCPVASRRVALRAAEHIEERMANGLEWYPDFPAQLLADIARCARLLNLYQADLLDRAAETAASKALDVFQTAWTPTRPATSAAGKERTS